MFKKIFNSKMAVSIFSSVSIISVGAAVATISTIIAHKNTQGNVFYKFNDKTFRTQSDLMTYVNSNSKMESFSTENKYYLYNGKAYDVNEFSGLKTDMFNQTPIIEHSTYRNPYNYGINTANQLSSQVLTTDSDKLIDVYQGKDGNAYLSKQEAIKTFRDYKKIYKLGNIINDGATVEFENKHEAIQYLENIVEKKLDQGVQTESYEMAGSFFTKDQMKDWLKSVTDIEYEYNGHRWSKLEHPDISKMSLTQKDDATYIQKYNQTKNSYWLNIDSNGLGGSFTGTQFIESDWDELTINEKLKNNWKKIEKQSINSNLASLVALSSLINLSLNSTAKEEDSGWDIQKDFFDYTVDGEKKFKDSFLSSNHSDYKDSGGFNYKNIKDKLNQIKGMTRWQKTLVFIQNTYNYTLTVNHLNGEEQAMAFINLLKDMLKNIIKAHTSMFDSSIDDLFKDQNSLFPDSESLNINDIIHMFISPSKFMYESPSKANGLDKVISSIQSTTDQLFSTMDQAAQIYNSGKNEEEKAIKMVLTSYESFMKNGKKTYNIDGKEVSASEAFNKVKQTLHDGFKEGFSKVSNKVGLPKGFAKLGKVAGKFVSKFVAGFELAKAAWEMGNLLSPVDYVTYENDFGNGQKLYYQTSEFKIPFVNIPLKFTGDFTNNIQQVQVFKNQVPFKNDDNIKPLDLYVVLGSLYNGKANAQDYLKHYIIQNPTKFVSTRQYYVNIMSKQEEKQIPSDPDKVDGLDKLTEFTDEIFNKYFASNPVKMYFDGIDGFYKAAVDAKNSMKQKISHNQFIIKYKFTDQEGISKYYDDSDTLIVDQDKYNETYLLKSKTILASDLIKTIKYDKLTEQFGVTSKVYEIIFNGQAKYFLTEEDAKQYIYRNSDVAYKEETTINYHVYFDWC